MKSFLKMLRDSKGATAIEYGLIAALIAVAAVSAMTTLGGQLQTTFNGAAEKMKGAEAGGEGEGEGSGETTP